jgi:hypothetical protein
MESFQAFQRIVTAAEISVCDEAGDAAVFKRYSDVLTEHLEPDALQFTLTRLAQRHKWHCILHTTDF